MVSGKGMPKVSGTRNDAALPSRGYLCNFADIVL